MLEKCKHSNNYIQRECCCFFNFERREKSSLKNNSKNSKQLLRTLGFHFFIFFHCYFLFDLNFNNKCISNVQNPSHCTCMKLKALDMKCSSNTHYVCHSIPHSPCIYTDACVHQNTHRHLHAHTNVHTRTHTHTHTHTHRVLQPLTSLRIISWNSTRTAYITSAATVCVVR